MQINKDFTIQKVGASYVAVPVGETSKTFHGMVRLNETGAFLWNCLSEHKTEQQLVDCLKSEYEGASDEEFAADVAQFVSLLKENNILE